MNAVTQQPMTHVEVPEQILRAGDTKNWSFNLARPSRIHEFVLSEGFAIEELSIGLKKYSKDEIAKLTFRTRRVLPEDEVKVLFKETGGEDRTLNGHVLIVSAPIINAPPPLPVTAPAQGLQAPYQAPPVPPHLQSLPPHMARAMAIVEARPTNPNPPPPAPPAAPSYFQHHAPVGTTTPGTYGTMPGQPERPMVDHADMAPMFDAGPNRRAVILTLGQIEKLLHVARGQYVAPPLLVDCQRPFEVALAGR